MSSNDVHTSYKTFVNLFTNLYDKHCPFKEKRVYNNDLKTWFTKCLRNACKKKNILYRRFLSHRSLENETRYKLYKNKLTFILRMTEKNYYSKLLQKHKNDVKVYKDELIDVSIDEFILTRVCSTKFLGVQIDEGLNWKEHIKISTFKSLRYHF